MIDDQTAVRRAVGPRSGLRRERARALRPGIDAALGADHDALRCRARLDQHRHDLRQADRHRQRRHLDDEIVGVAIDDQPAQAVAFAEDQPGGALRARRSPAAPRTAMAASNRRRQKASSSGSASSQVYSRTRMRLRLLKIPRAMNLPLSRAEIDDVAVGRIAFDAVDGRIEHPGVPAVERAGLAGFQDDLGHGGGGRGLGARDQGLGARDQGLGARDQGLGVRYMLVWQLHCRTLGKGGSATATPTLFHDFRQRRPQPLVAAFHCVQSVYSTDCRRTMTLHGGGAAIKIALQNA